MPPRSVARARDHFDALGPALAAAVRVFSFDDWHAVVLGALNAAREPYRQVAPEAGVGAVAYFVAFGVAAFLFTILFIGVIYGTFTYITTTRRDGGAARARVPSLKRAQWAVYRAKLGCIAPRRELAPPAAGRRGAAALFALYRTRRYKAAYAALVAVDVAYWVVGSGLARRHYDARAAPRAGALGALAAADAAAVALLCADFGARAAAFGPRRVLLLGAEQLRLALLVPVAAHALGGALLPPVARRAAAALRGLAVFLVAPAFEDAGAVLRATVASLATLGPLLALLVVLTFSYAVVGTFLYSPRLDYHLDRDAAKAARAYGLGRRRGEGVARFDFRTTAKGMESLFVAARADVAPSARLRRARRRTVRTRSRRASRTRRERRARVDVDRARELQSLAQTSRLTGRCPRRSRRRRTRGTAGRAASAPAAPRRHGTARRAGSSGAPTRSSRATSS